MLQPVPPPCLQGKFLCSQALLQKFCHIFGSTPPPGRSNKVAKVSTMTIPVGCTNQETKVTTMTLPVGTRVNEKRQRLEESGNERLLPQIPDEITLNLIAPTLSWGDCQRLSSVSRGWRHAVQSGEVQDARIRQRSTETLIVLSHKPSETSREIALYSITDNRCYKLPPFPLLDGRIPPTSHCVSLDGKIYVLGGQFVRIGLGILPDSNGVYVLDLAGGSQWKRCARMIKPRVRFGCGVLDGKIYVFGGLNNKTPLCGSEVYDPKQDTWSPIKAMTCLRFDHEVATVGAELLVHGGKVVGQTGFEWLHWTNYLSEKVSREAEWNDTHEYGNHCYPPLGSDIRVLSLVCAGGGKANSFEVYNAVKDDWSVAEAIRRQETDLSFMAGGELHGMNSDEIHVHDAETNSWKHLHSHSFSVKGLVDSKLIVLRAALAVDDRLLTIVEGIDQYGEIKVSKACLLQSRGLGSGNEEIQWERAPFRIYFEEKDIQFTNYSMQTIKL